MRKEAIYKRNDRVEFKDSEGYFHIGYVKKTWVERRGWFRTERKYDICEYVRALTLHKVHTVPERDVFGIVEAKPKEQPPKGAKAHKTYHDLADLAELKQDKDK